MLATTMKAGNAAASRAPRQNSCPMVTVFGLFSLDVIAVLPSGHAGANAPALQSLSISKQNHGYRDNITSFIEE